MFKYNYTKSELDNIEKELYLTPFQRRIIEYRMLDLLSSFLFFRKE